MAGEVLAAHPLVAFLRDPQYSSARFDIRAWSELLRAARRSNLIARVACVAEASGVSADVPDKVRFHLRSGLRVSRSSRLSTLREVRLISRALEGANVPCILLKGAAYVVAGIDAGNGRLLSDIDIMVPHDRLVEAETAFARNGWMTTKLDAYDQRYYRQWMHELPPMRHLTRGTSLDIHHTILPPTARLRPNVELLWRSANALSEPAGMMVLGGKDMILHSATHLFHEGEFDNGLRDLFDMDALIREFCVEPAFWDDLLQRAALLDLEWPLYYALRYCAGIAGSPIPDQVLRQSEQAMPSALVRRLMDQLVVRSIGNVLGRRASVMTGMAQFAMYVRSHYLRMPVQMLIPHLLRKQFVGER